MPPVPPIFRSELQLRLLALMLMNPQQPWTVRELTERLDAMPLTVHRELHRALVSGVVERDPVGRTYLYRAAQHSPLYEPLRTLAERTVGIEAELRDALQGVPGVEAAFLHGSLAKGAKIRPTSDVDVIVLGTMDPRAVRRSVRAIEKRLGREIDVLAYRPEEFASLVRSRNSLAQNIVRGPTTPLIGSREILKRS